MIHETAIINPTARLAPDVQVGPFTVIGPDVEIGEGTVIGPHVVVNGPSKIGKHNQIFQFASVGEAPQDKKFSGETTWLEMGDNNVVREGVTLNRGTGLGGGVTRIGNGNLFMAYAHIAHDCIVGNHIIFANNATLAGHIEVEDFVVFSGFSAVHQFCRIGKYSFLAKCAKIGKDVLPYTLVAGENAAPYGLNVEGLRRHGFTRETIAKLRLAYKIIYRKNLTIPEVIAELTPLAEDCPQVQDMLHFVQHSQRGILR
jgi:UDP-N-acetylglucosamine acyltransferase